MLWKRDLFYFYFIFLQSQLLSELLKVFFPECVNTLVLLRLVGCVLRSMDLISVLRHTLSSPCAHGMKILLKINFGKIPCYKI